ncbi:MAG: twin-arginine translocase TatA/TatE family subunit [Spirochaetes bacterium]|nr:twin-arginine translocase TatA/TatE family subunit [Spirochaetota bacterium]
MMIGTNEILLIIGVAILIFGARKIPDIARSIGTGIREFKKALNPSDEEDVYEIKKKNIKKINARKKKKK